MKPKIAFYWCAACGGCEECIVDLNEDLPRVTDVADIVFWPVALDFKKSDVAAMPDGSITVTFINGAIRSDEQLEMARLFREKSEIIVAFGACAQMGGVPGLANLVGRITDPPSAPVSNGNGGFWRLPALFDRVQPLDRAIQVDYYIPGCPPTPQIIRAARDVLLIRRELPPRGTVLAPDYALCSECPRKATRPEDLHIDQFRRVQECILDEDTCILAQGVVCLGPATRAGCEALCISGNMPCTGCFGPTGRVKDFGGKALSSIASLMVGREEEELDRAVEQLPDPAGTFYRYCLPSSVLESKPGGRVS